MPCTVKRHILLLRNWRIAQRWWNLRSWGLKQVRSLQFQGKDKGFFMLNGSFSVNQTCTSTEYARPSTPGYLSVSLHPTISSAVIWRCIEAQERQSLATTFCLFFSHPEAKIGISTGAACKQMAVSRIQRTVNEISYTPAMQILP